MFNEEQQLIDGCKKNDRRAQEQLYKNYYKAMMKLCVRYMANDADAVEVLNNGFLKVFKNIHRYESGQASLYTWIRTIVINSCLDFIKARGRKEQHKELIEEIEADVPADVISKMKADDLLKLVRSLSPSAQAVFNLYVIEGYNHREIGQLLGISDGTSKWYLSEARKSLQKMIQLQDVHS